MNLLFEIFVSLIIWLGAFFLFVGSLGLVRLPDIFTRMHATSKCDTLGSGLVLFAVILTIGYFAQITKLIFIIGFIWSINPVVAHLIAKIEYMRDTPLTPGSFIMNHYSPDRSYIVDMPKEGSDNVDA